MLVADSSDFVQTQQVLDEDVKKLINFEKE